MALPLERVLISGAGIAGSALALALEARGVAVDVVERRLLADMQDGAGILLPGNAVRALSRLNVALKLEPHARRISTVAIADASDMDLARIDCSSPHWPQTWAIRYSVLRRILLDEIKTQIRFGTTILEIQQEPSPWVTFSDGSTQQYDLVVGADGASSALRKLMNGSASSSGLLTGFAGYRFVAPSPVGMGEPRYLIGEGRTFLLIPIPQGEVYCGAGPIAEERCVRRATPLESIRATYADFGGLARAVLERVDDSTQLIPSRFWNLVEPQWTSGRLMLIGDAAHALPPTLAQGAAMALEDVVVLVEELEAASSVPKALTEFVRRRQPRVQMVQKESLARMPANAAPGRRNDLIRSRISAKVGAASLGRIWSKLVRELP